MSWVSLECLGLRFNYYYHLEMTFSIENHKAGQHALHRAEEERGQVHSITKGKVAAMLEALKKAQNAQKAGSRRRRRNKRRRTMKKMH